MVDVFDFKGGPELRRELRRIEQRFLSTMGKAIEAEAKTVMAAGQAAAPRETGGLASSAKVVVSRRQTKVEGAAAFTNPNAAAIHEGVHWGRKSKTTRGFHWYRNVAQDWEPAAAKRVITKLQAITNEGGGGSVPGATGKKAKPSKLQKRLGKAARLGAKGLRKASKLGRKASKSAAKAAKKAGKVSKRAAKKGERFVKQADKAAKRAVTRATKKAVKNARKVAKGARKLTRRRRR